MNDLLQWWLDWGAIVCLVTSIFVAAMAVFHAVRHSASTAALTAVIVAPVLILPSVILKTQLDAEALADISTSPLRDLAVALFLLGGPAWIVAGVGAIGQFLLAEQAVSGQHSKDNPGYLQVWLEMWDAATHWLQPVDERWVTIGRDQYNKIIVVNPDVSRAHAVLEQQGDRLFLTDLGSSFGTYLNNQIVAGPVELRSFDVLRFGSTASARVLITSM